MTLEEKKTVIQFEVLLSAAEEVGRYAKDIMRKQFVDNLENVPRKLRREKEKNFNAGFDKLLGHLSAFSNIIEAQNPEMHDHIIDKICEFVDKNVKIEK